MRSLAELKVVEEYRTALYDRIDELSERAQESARTEELDGYVDVNKSDNATGAEYKVRKI